MTDQRLNTCHVITRMIVGGAQENTLLTVKGHMARGHRSVLVTGPSPGPEGELLANERVPGLEWILLPQLVRPLHPVADVHAYRWLKDYFRRENFDVVHTHSSKAGFLGRLAARHAGVPLVLHTVHGQAFHPYQSWMKNRLYMAAERWAARHCDRILAVAQAMVDQCVAAHIAPRDKYRVVYSGMDLEPFLTARADPVLRQKLGLPENVPVVGKIARLFELKGHDFLFAAMPHIVDRIPDVHFLLVGDGPLRPRLEARAAAMGLRDRVVFTGLVPPSTIPHYTALMDVLVHLSLREGLPRTVVQALASGIPAVGFALDGTPEVILDGRTGRLCPPESVPDVVAAVVDLLQHPEARERMGHEGRSRVERQFDWRHMADVIEEEYHRGLEARRSSRENHPPAEGT